MKKIVRLGTLTLASLCIVMLVAVAVSAANFSDIEKHWSKEYVEYGVEKGYISGYEDGTFLPDKTVTRAEFSKMINSAISITSTGDAKAEFKDVKSTDWFFNEVKKAENAGYITGYEDGSFRPANSINRQEAAVVLSRVVLPIDERADIYNFNDGASVDNWATDSVTMIAAKGYIKGDENGNFNPKGALTRGQAAKLICEFVKNENIINRNQSLTSANKEIVYSETLFTDDIVIDVKDAEDVSVVFKNCRVLGNIYIKTAGATVKLECTKVKNVYVNAEDVAVEIDSSSEVKNAYVASPATLVGDGFKKIVLSGDDLSSGLVRLDGSVDKVEVSGDAMVAATEIGDFDVTAKVSLVLQSGKVKKLTAESAAKGSTINLSKKVVVEKALNKSAVSYIGSGTIKEAENSVTGVVFDGVTVEKTTGKVADNGDGTGTTSTDFFYGVEVTPEKGKTNQAISVNAIFTFNKEVFDKDGEKLTADYIEKYFEFTKGTSTDVKFDASVASSNKKITLNPVQNLSNSATYYVTIPAGVLTYDDGSTNEKFTTNFKTAAPTGTNEGGSSNDEDDENASVTMSPKSGSDDVSVTTSIKLTFSGTLKAYSGSLDEDYIEEEAIEIREGSKTGETVNFSASISGKTITLSPSRLLGSTDYYVIILGNKIKVGGDTLSKTTLSFTTEEGTPITISPANGTSNISTTPEITVSFAEPMLQMDGEDALTEDYIIDEVLYIKKSSAKDSAEDVYYSVKEIAENGKSFVIVPDDELEAGTTYYIIIIEESLFGETTETENAKFTSNFKTASAMAPMFTPYDGKENVGIGTELKISFSDELLVYAKDKTDRVAVDDAYLEELINGYEDDKGKIVGKNRIALKRIGSSTNKLLDITATLDSDGKTIIITPAEALDPEKTYELSIEKNLFYSCADGKTYKANTSGEARFDTNIAMSPEITPKDGAEKIAVTVNPTIKFKEKIYKGGSDNDELKSSHIKKALSFVDQYGEEVEFEVEVDGSVITIEPKEDLEGNVEYTLTLAEGAIQNEDGITNEEKSVTFTTKVSYTMDITPASAKKNISPLVKPVVKFGTTMYTVDYDPVDTEYAAEYIFITEGTKSTDAGDAIDATIEIDADGRTFTIIPDEQLEFNTKYYINVVAKQFLFDDEDTENKAANYYFTTIKEPALTKCSAAAVNKSSIKITYTSNVADDSDDELAQLVIEDENGEEVERKPITSTSSSSVTIKKLEADTPYTFYAYIVYDGEIVSETVEVSATTKAS